MANPLSGSGGSVKSGGVAMAHIRKWSVTPKVEVKEYRDSGTSGQTGRVRAWSDWEGSIEMYLDNGAWPSGVLMGQTYLFQFLLKTGETLDGQAIVMELPIEVAIEDGDLEAVTISIGGNGILKRNTSTTILSTDTPTPVFT